MAAFLGQGRRTARALETRRADARERGNARPDGSRATPCGLRRLAAAAGAARAGAAIVAALLLAAAQTASARPLDPNGTDWEGLSQLVRLAQEELGPGRVVLATRLDLNRLKAADALLLVHPERELDTDELFSFVDAGGRIALLDDFGTGDRLLAALGSRRVDLPEHPSSMLRAHPSLAVADSVGVHPLVHDVTRVVTNHATGIAGGPLRPLLVVRSKLDAVVVAGASVIGKGRIVVVGDSSVAMNAMLRFPGNRSLASALLAYCGPAADSEASNDGEGKLYLLANDFVMSGGFGGRSWRTRTQAALGRMAEAAEDALRRGMPPTLTYLFAIAVGIGVVVWTAVNAGKMYRPSMPAFTRPVPLRAQGGVAGHAAALASAGATREVALRELKIALEEHLAARLGLESVVPLPELVARARAARLIDEHEMRTLTASLARLSRLAARFARPRLFPFDRVRAAEVRSITESVRTLLAAVDAPRRGTVRTRS